MGGYSPMTPSGAASPYAPYTPGGAVEQPPLQEWCTTDIEVRIRDTHDDRGLCGQTGVIRGISVSMPALSLLFRKKYLFLK